MTDRAPTSSSRQASSLRRLKILVVLLIFSNIAVGGLGFYFLRATDRKYSELIGRTVPTLNDMQTLTAAIMDAMRSVNPTYYNGSPENRTEMAQRARRALKRDHTLRDTILGRSWLSSDTKERKDFQQSGEAFSDKAAGLVPLLESGNIAEATKQREQTVRPLFDHYIAATGKAADLLQVQSLKTSDSLSAHTVSVSTLILGVAGWPLLVFVVLLFAALIMTLVLRVFIFDRENAT